MSVYTTYNGPMRHFDDYFARRIYRILILHGIFSYTTVPSVSRLSRKFPRVAQLVKTRPIARKNSFDSP